MGFRRPQIEWLWLGFQCRLTMREEYIRDWSRFKLLLVFFLF